MGVNSCGLRVGIAVIQAGQSRAERALRRFKVSRSPVTVQQLLDNLLGEEEALEREVLTRNKMARDNSRWCIVMDLIVLVMGRGGSVEDVWEG
ncbi:hypothetical protein [Alicyclobacillus sendaiensis]|uniref:hypothetical protein n=1 Tax=Alicyclobacillus sendaiensis TaxID=192387 RepID=UPI000A3F996D|nr:hypothetical protein [Alicyclobacillus sendaiensis]